MAETYRDAGAAITPEVVTNLTAEGLDPEYAGQPVDPFAYEGAAAGNVTTPLVGPLPSWVIYGLIALCIYFLLDEDAEKE